MKKLFAFFFVFIFVFSFFPSFVFSLGNESIIVLTHSTGRNLYNDGSVASWFNSYNSEHETSFVISRRDYPSTPYPWNNYAYDYWNLWVNGACDSSNPYIECLDTLAESYDVIVWKHCYPGSAVLPDLGSPDVSSSRKSLENYKLQYRAILSEMDKYPETLFIVWTNPPLHRLSTNPDQALLASEFASWVINDWLLEDGMSHDNVFIWDFRSIVTDYNSSSTQFNMLKWDYERSHTSGDSHPNVLANQISGPLLSQFIVDSIESFDSFSEVVSQDVICEATIGNCYYIAPDGNDDNNGSFMSPFASTNPIIDVLNPGDYIYFRGGNYGPLVQGQNAPTDYPPNFPSIAYLSHVSGTQNNPITFKAYPGELPVFDMYEINPEFDPYSYGSSGPVSTPVHSPDNAFHLYNSDYIVIEGFEIIHGSINVFDSDYTWIKNNHIHEIYTDRDNNGLIILYFTKHAYVDNNDLHDSYSRTISDGNGGWMFNSMNSHEDAQHNGCITTLSGDGYQGYGIQSSGPFEFTNNTIHDCPVHLFIKNSQGQLVNEEGINLLVKDNYFFGEGSLAIWFKATNVLFENNLFKGIGGISSMGCAEYTGDQEILNEICARNVLFKNNVFTSVSRVIGMRGLGFLLENGIYSTAMEDKLQFHNNVVVFNFASVPGTMHWNQGGYAFGNTYVGMIDSTGELPSKTLSRIDSKNNCYINSEGENIAFLKHWVNGSQSITGISFLDAVNNYNINGQGDLFPSNTELTDHFNNVYNNDFSIKNTSPCFEIFNVGLTHPEYFENLVSDSFCSNGVCEVGENYFSCSSDCPASFPDLIELAYYFGSSQNNGIYNLIYDLDNNGVINVIDIMILILDFE